MKLQEAAFIIGSMGGRPPTRAYVQPYKERRGGFLQIETFYLLQEDGTSRIILEDGSGFLQLEF